MATQQENKDIAIGQLKNISSWVSSVHDLNQLLELILHTGTRIMRAKASSLLLLDQKTQKLYFKVTTGTQKDKMKNFEISLGQGIVGHVAETGQPLLIEDVTQDKRWYRNISDEIGFKTRSILCVPMKVKDNVIGAIEFINKAEGGSFQQSDLELLNVFADVAALAIANAKKIPDRGTGKQGIKAGPWPKSPDYRRKQGHPGSHGRRTQGCGLQSQHAHSGGKRHRQGTPGPADPPGQFQAGTVYDHP